MDYFQKNIQFFMGQHYQAIKESCLKSKTLFNDQQFLANDESIFYGQANVSIEWKHLKEVCEEPHLYVQDPSHTDVFYNEYGSSSFLIATSILAANQDFWNRVVPDSHSQEKNLSVENGDEYCGIFRFRFWRFGTWIEVVVDDRLPTVNGKLYGIRSSLSNEFWCALVEKAYAKLVGCYEAIHHTNSGCIIQDMTGSVLQDIPLAPAATNIDARNTLFKELCESCKSGRVILTCCISADEENPIGNETFLGLKVGYHYVVSSIKELKPQSLSLRRSTSEKQKLIRIRDPTGAEDWIGPWSNRSNQWRQFSDGERRKIGLITSVEGEFWMSFNDFCNNFTDISMCRVVSPGGIMRDNWQESWLFGRWRQDDNPDINSAGGSLDVAKNTFTQNPQFRFDIADGVKGYVIIQLQQKEQRNIHSMEPMLHHRIGMHLLKVEGNRVFKMHRLFDDDLVVITPHFANRTSLLLSRLPKGRYVLVPTTLEPMTDAEFFLRIYSQATINFSALDGVYPERSCWAFCTGYPQIVTRVRVSQGRNCIRLQRSSVGNVFVTISCEGQMVRSRTFKNDRDPAFDTRAIFYRKKPTVAPIVFSVFYDGLLCNTFIGQGSTKGGVDDSGTSIEIPLFGRGNLAGKRYPGTIFIDITSSENIHTL